MRSDHHHQSVWSHMKKLRLNPEELCLKTLQETSCKAPEKLCSLTHTHTQIQKNCVSRRFKKPPAKLLRNSAHTLTHTHTLTHSLTHTLTHTPRRTVSQDASRNLLQSSWETLLTHTHTGTHTHTDPEELCLKTLQETSCKAPEKLCSHTHTHTHRHTHTHTLTHTHTHTHTLTHTHTHTHTHTDPEELCLKTLQETSCKAPEKLCSRAPRTKPALNTKMLTTNDDLL